MKSKGWNLTFSDEFSGKALNRDVWNDQYWHGRTHGPELQWYAPDVFEVSKGRLRVKAEKRDAGEGDDKRPYTSGVITTLGRFSQEYGWFEIRAKFPAGKGYWPAFWLLPETKAWPPEIDVLEILGHEMNKVYMTNHWKDDAGKHQQNGGSWVGPDFGKDYHVFAVDWRPDVIIWYVDGIERYRSDRGVPSGPFYVIANLAVGGEWPGSPDAKTVLPGYMDIDYIRVYKLTVEAVR